MMGVGAASDGAGLGAPSSPASVGADGLTAAFMGCGLRFMLRVKLTCVTRLQRVGTGECLSW